MLYIVEIHARRRDSMIRVVEVLEATYAGAARHVREVLSALPADEFEVRLLCAVQRNPSFADDVERFRQRGIEVHVLPMTRGLHPLWDPIAAMRLRSLLQQRPCDILHLHSSKAGWLGRLAAWDLDCHIVYTPHAFAFLQRVAAPLRWGYEAAERFAARRTDMLLAVAAAEGRLAVERGLLPADRVRVLPNAVDVAALDREMVTLPVPPARQTRSFGFIAELRRQKDPLTFLAAARHLVQRGVLARFVMPASGPLLPEVTRYIERYGLREAVTLVDTTRSLAPLYSETDVAVLPALWEALPYALLDALALRRPVIASCLPSIEEILRPLDDRLLTSPGNVTALAEQMEVWARAPVADLHTLGEKGRRYVVEHHDLNRWRESLRELYRSLARATSSV